ncbi:hypothetical protein BVX98_00790 [bacterium F11]|nr:hypothetical protein BVX98_00790 [bacterium F11]
MPTIWKRNLMALSFAQFVSIIGMSFFLPFIPLYLKELGLQSDAEISTWSGVLFSAGFLMLSLSAPLWGAWADRFGRKPMVVRATGAASLVLFATAFVQTPSQLLVLRLVHGCFCGFVSSAIALIASETPERSLSFALGLFQSALTAGFIVGPFFGGVLQDFYGIRLAIFIGACIVLCGALLVWVFVREEHKPEKKDRSFSIWKNAEFLFKNSTLWPAARLQFVSNMSLMSVQPILALFVTFLAEASNPHIGTLAGLVVSATALSMMVGAPFWGRMADRWSQRKVLTICLFMAGLTFIPQAMAQSVSFLFFSRFLLGFFSAGIAPSLQALIAKHTPTDRKAGVLGVSFSFTLMGNAVGPLLGGALAAALGLRIPFILTAVLLFIAGLMSRSLKIKLVKAPATSLTQSD